MAQETTANDDRTSNGTTTPVTAAAVAAALDRARRRSLTYTDIDTDELVRQHSPLMSPLVWDLAHIGNYEDLWLVRALGAADPTRPGLDDIYDAFRHSRASRIRLALLGPDGARDYLREVRGRALDLLDRFTPLPVDPHSTGPADTDTDTGARAEDAARLLTDGFVYAMVIQHEHQHDETMLATHQLRAGPPLLDAGAPPPPGRTVPRREVLVPAGPFTLGTSADPWALDNERPAHRVDLPAFWIDTLPVGNRAQIAFIEAGGYDDERLWSPAGWEWRQQEGLSAPEFWQRDGDTWLRRRLGRVEPVPLDEPVQHVCWYEAQAHARWAGRRLPTEAEWEKAAAHDPVTGRSLRYPWGDTDPTPNHANLGHRTSGPAPLGAYPAGASPCGAEQMIGDVWEWTASGFTAYPGFRSFPYREYSEVFFPKGGEPASFKVLRGGSWAADAAAVRTTFRNWDYPIRRQIFAGFRLARDAD
ncbi:ergothioneine biosynthesis protein EgtB [Frankia sp. AgKG'84/4]|uniref:ergothioneine biosynthesis protein EgtB n=1 Tax=Frankia sp. AgKG'84/4 TaxID=573490 RepID=UPI00200D2093|nr:ergothioneine biosynthesis protein EgtB [Frankia sp. AgKG'84/4]MCL9798398.1 ergothioneine biosynthesis protein EgtB [Frankia sp. AgKG'84/4]